MENSQKPCKKTLNLPSTPTNISGMPCWVSSCSICRGNLEHYAITTSLPFLAMQKQFHRMSVATSRLIKGSDPKDPSSVNDLGHWDSRDSNSEFAPLTNALVTTSQAMETISKEWGTHVRKTHHDELIYYSASTGFFFFLARALSQPLCGRLARVLPPSYLLWCKRLGLPQVCV